MQECNCRGIQVFSCNYCSYVWYLHVWLQWHALFCTCTGVYGWWFVSVTSCRKVHCVRLFLGVLWGSELASLCSTGVHLFTNQCWLLGCMLVKIGIVSTALNLCSHCLVLFGAVRCCSVLFSAVWCCSVLLVLFGAVRWCSVLFIAV